MAVRSKRLFAPAALGAAAVVYTVPSGETTLLKSLVFRNATAVTTTIAIGTGNSTGVGQLFSRTLAAGETVYVDCWIALPAGVTLNASATPASNSARISGYGAELEGEAD